MENEIQPTQAPQLNQEQMLAEILDNSRKTKSYMKWQLIITVALVVVPLIAMIAIIPFAMKSLTSIYEVSSGIDGGLNSSNVQDLIQQYTK